MDIIVTKKVKATECTNQFISPGDTFTEYYVIAKMAEKEYAIVNKSTGISLVLFESMEKITDNIWVLNINATEKKAIDVSAVIPNLSDPFSKVIKVFENEILIEYENGKRDIIELGNMKPIDYSFFDPYSFFNLPNGKYSVVNMHNLKVSKEEFGLENEDFI